MGRSACECALGENVDKISFAVHDFPPGEKKGGGEEIFKG